MLALVVDTSSAAVTAAVVDIAGSGATASAAGAAAGAGDAAAPTVSVLGRRVTLNARGHGELLAPSIRDSLADGQAEVTALRAVIAGLGPGPFTGLRVGLVTASVLADTLGVPAYGVCSLDAIAYPHRDVADLLVATDARRHEVYWARYRRGERIGELDVSRPADIDLAGVTGATGVQAHAYDFGVPRYDGEYPSPEALAALAAARVVAGAPGEVLTPLYLRRPDAVANLVTKPVSQ